MQSDAAEKESTLVKRVRMERRQNFSQHDLSKQKGNANLRLIREGSKFNFSDDKQSLRSFKDIRGGIHAPLAEQDPNVIKNLSKDVQKLPKILEGERSRGGQGSSASSRMMENQPSHAEQNPNFSPSTNQLSENARCKT